VTHFHANEKGGGQPSFFCASYWRKYLSSHLQM